MAGFAGLRSRNMFNRILAFIGQLACAVMAYRTCGRWLNLSMVKNLEARPGCRFIVMAGLTYVAGI